jgi:hypothetical protein
MTYLARNTVKGTVSPDVRLYFRFWQIKLVLSAGPLVVFTLFSFVFIDLFKYLYFNCLFENTY